MPAWSQPYLRLANNMHPKLLMNVCVCVCVCVSKVHGSLPQFTELKENVNNNKKKAFELSLPQRREGDNSSGMQKCDMQDVPTQCFILAHLTHQLLLALSPSFNVGTAVCTHYSVTKSPHAKVTKQNEDIILALLVNSTGYITTRFCTRESLIA